MEDAKLNHVLHWIMVMIQELYLLSQHCRHPHQTREELIFLTLLHPAITCEQNFKVFEVLSLRQRLTLNPEGFTFFCS